MAYKKDSKVSESGITDKSTLTVKGWVLFNSSGFLARGGSALKDLDLSRVLIFSSYEEACNQYGGTDYAVVGAIGKAIPVQVKAKSDLIYFAVRSTSGYCEWVSSMDGDNSVGFINNLHWANAARHFTREAAVKWAKCNGLKYFEVRKVSISLDVLDMIDASRPSIADPFVK